MTDFIIKIRHSRIVQQPPNNQVIEYRPVLMTMKEIIDQDVPRDWIKARGGKTEVGVYNLSGEKLSEAVSVCSEYDGFNRKVGRDVAIGKALKKMLILV